MTNDKKKRAGLRLTQKDYDSIKMLLRMRENGEPTLVKIASLLKWSVATVWRINKTKDWDEYSKMNENLLKAWKDQRQKKEVKVEEKKVEVSEPTLKDTAE